MCIEIPAGKALAAVEIQGITKKTPKEVHCKDCYFFTDGVQKCRDYNFALIPCRFVYRPDHKDVVYQLVDYQPQG